MGKRSRAWWILPIFFGIGGGITAWVMLRFGILVKKESSDFPFKLLVVGFVIGGIVLTLRVVEIGVAQIAFQDALLNSFPLYSLLT